MTLGLVGPRTELRQDHTSASDRRSRPFGIDGADFRIDGDGFALEHLSRSGAVEISGDNASPVLVVWTIDGRVETNIHHVEASAGPGEVLIAATGTAAFHVVARDAHIKMAILDRDLFDRAAAGRGPVSGGSVRMSPFLGGLTPRNRAATRLWTRTFTYVTETMTDDHEAVTPLVSANAGRLLAVTALAVFGATGLASAANLVEELPPEAQPAMLRRAIAYIEAHAQFDVSVNDIAAAVYLTPRALQYTFRKHLDITPMGYLRRVRLEHVHEELVRSNRRNATVATIAARWGFAHTGRFAVVYRETYGRSPHVTLRE